MNKQEAINTFSGPSAYQITVLGQLDEHLLQNLGEFKITYIRSGEKQISTLTGNVLDQPALSGILATLIDHRYLLVSVIKIA